ncbi:MAG: hypothetical protein JKX82_06475 [Oleispira sp.]|nr:hypothetical protein [Oleispira sp.]
MMKERGYYTIEVAGQEIIGHFSVNFWALLEEILGFQTIEEMFGYIAQGVSLSQIRNIIYCTSSAYCEEKGLPRLFKNLAQCGLALGDFTDDHFNIVMAAFTGCKLMGLDVGVAEKESEDDKGK